LPEACNPTEHCSEGKGQKFEFFRARHPLLICEPEILARGVGQDGSFEDVPAALDANAGVIDPDHVDN
jgi:hypothetical protein